jgi:hypothetical protein
MKNTKSFSFVSVRLVGADAVTALKLAVEVPVIEVFFLKKLFLK